MKRTHEEKDVTEAPNGEAPTEPSATEDEAKRQKSTLHKLGLYVDTQTGHDTLGSGEGNSSEAIQNPKEGPDEAAEKS